MRTEPPFSEIADSFLGMLTDHELDQLRDAFPQVIGQPVPRLRTQIEAELARRPARVHGQK